ncbi:hypothetical protein HDU99_005234, partial [Rhizoclosmatium hyalinum]
GGAPQNQQGQSQVGAGAQGANKQGQQNVPANRQTRGGYGGPGNPQGQLAGGNPAVGGMNASSYYNQQQQLGGLGNQGGYQGYPAYQQHQQPYQSYGRQNSNQYWNGQA